jgi:hypothetical protein
MRADYQATCTGDVWSHCAIFLIHIKRQRPQHSENVETAIAFAAGEKQKGVVREQAFIFFNCAGYRSFVGGMSACMG